MKKFIKISNIPLFLLSFVITVVVWYFVMTINNPVIQITYRDVPVVYNGQTQMFDKNSMVLLSGEGATVTLRMEGRRNDILRLNKSDIAVVADLSAIDKAGEQKIQCRVLTPNNNITLVRNEDARITIKTDKIVENQLNVIVETIGIIGDGFVFGEIKSNPETVIIKGPQSEVSLISHMTAVIEEEQFIKSKEYTLPLAFVDNSGKQVTPDDVQCMTKNVTVTLPVLYSVELPFSVTVLEGGGLKKENVEITINPETVVATGDYDKISQMESINIGTVDLSKIVESTQLEMAILPQPDIQIKSDITSADVSINITGMTRRVFTVTNDNIQVGTVPNGLTADVKTKKIEVTLRGKTDFINSLTDEDIFVKGEFEEEKEYTEGNYTLNTIVEIALPNEGDYALVGTYIISVALK